MRRLSWLVLASLLAIVPVCPAQEQKGKPNPPAPAPVTVPPVYDPLPRVEDLRTLQKMFITPSGTEAEYALRQKLAQQRSEQFKRQAEQFHQMQDTRRQQASRKATLYGIAILLGVVIGLVRLAYAVGRR